MNNHESTFAMGDMAVEKISVPSATPQHIISDIGEKFASDVTAAAVRNFQLVDNAKAQFVIGTFGTAAALGMTAAAYVEANGGSGDPEQMVDVLWSFIRPMALGTITEAVEANTATPASLAGG